MGHWLEINGRIVALVTVNRYGKRQEIGRGELMGRYTPEQIADMRQRLAVAQSVGESREMLLPEML